MRAGDAPDFCSTVGLSCRSHGRVASTSVKAARAGVISSGPPGLELQVGKVGADSGAKCVRARVSSNTCVPVKCAATFASWPARAWDASPPISLADYRFELSGQQPL